MTSEPLPDHGLGYFLYRSNAAAWLRPVDLRNIVASARNRNQKLHLTGCLHHEDGLFFQWLEGPGAALTAVIALITRDHRHDDITVLGQGPLDRRRFQGWRMRYSDKGDASFMDWLLARNIPTRDRPAYARGVAAFLQAVGS
ncbi:BLUF domain-containing protein [Paracoccus sp. (in: a-proteobacteria)]|uniref:BLUF domain-containing protein n=1 Tax=Paracoccus sp. TaxID=267 RepID=UPI003A872B08